MDNLEIERKFLIRMPPAAFLAALPSSAIEQTYILSDVGKRERVRRRDYGEKVVFTHTAKSRLSELSRIEIEEEISEARYRELLSRADPSRCAVKKTRYIYEYDSQDFEIDVYPFWDDRAIMELELESEDQPLRFPPGIELIREVTLDDRYSNSAIAREIPREQL